MDILSSIQFDPKQWPLAVTMFLRIVTILTFLPIFSEKVVLTRVRIALALIMTFALYPMVKEHLGQSDKLLQWNFLTLLVMTFREVLLGFAVGYGAKFLYYGTLIAAHWVGVNMGFQTATMFNPNMGGQESSFSILKTWFVLIVLLSLNIHHFFIEQIIRSFEIIPTGVAVNAANLAHSVIAMLTDCFHFAIRLAAPLIVVQVLIQVSLGLLNRLMPAFNVFIMSFPAVFLCSFFVLLIGVTSFLSFLSHYGVGREVAWVQTFFRVFAQSGAVNAK